LKQSRKKRRKGNDNINNYIYSLLFMGHTWLDGASKRGWEMTRSEAIRWARRNWSAELDNLIIFLYGKEGLKQVRYERKLRRYESKKESYNQFKMHLKFIGKL
jgi:hypothetical protein